MVDKQVRVLPLTPAFPCNDSELHNRMPLYAAFGAARRLLARIEQDAAGLVTSPSLLPEIHGSRRRHPNICSLLRVSAGNNTQAEERINFQITERLMTGLEGKRFLYLASTTDPNPQVILVKFSRQYSKDLHQFCTSVNHAPELLAFEVLPGGWFGIGMEYFPSAERILESKNLANHGEKWLADIGNIVTAIHTQGYVHGDLRPPNFIVDGETLLLVDFDWGGNEKDATFPQAQLHPILRDNRWEIHITKERDTKVMEYTKGEIRKKLEEQSSGGARS
jgi:serine/threonine protein kinase